MTKNKESKLAAFQVLIVDDEKTILRLVGEVLNSLGFKNVVIAGSGRQAIDLAKRQKFDFIITDWCMPDLDGIEIVRFMRSKESLHPRTPIIMLTGNTEARYVRTALNAGINGYVLKPFSAAQLIRRIRAVIENPRPFVMCATYRGPDRRGVNKGPPDGVERRKKNPKMVAAPAGR